MRWKFASRGKEILDLMCGWKVVSELGEEGWPGGAERGAVLEEIDYSWVQLVARGAAQSRYHQSLGELITNGPVIQAVAFVAVLLTLGLATLVPCPTLTAGGTKPNRKASRCEASSRNGEDSREEQVSARIVKAIHHVAI